MFKRLISLCVSAAVGLIYYRNATDNNTISSTIGTAALLFIISGITFDAYHEFYDHIDLHHDDQPNAENHHDDVNSNAETPTNEFSPAPTVTNADDVVTVGESTLTVKTPLLATQSDPYATLKTVGKIGLSLIALPPFGAATYNLFKQGLELPTLITSLPGVIYPLGIFAGSLLVLQYVAVPGLHLFRNLWGGHKELTQRVIGSLDEVTGLKSIPARLSVFIIFSFTHLAESFFLSKNLSAQNALYILSIIGLACGKAMSHTDHMSAIKNTYRYFKSNHCRHQGILVTTATISAFCHSASGTGATIYYWPEAALWQKILMIAADSVEAASGGLENVQHGGKNTVKYVQQLKCC